ncbi:MAG: phosphoribosylformylglycinamidine synthase subunit PurL [Candidatus Marinimicrobia bacterium]|nr:phosphoribosylformylglycinamidine synthase subunit PurL [Candidatus Neomarinimicrobiota bacterium]
MTIKHEPEVNWELAKEHGLIQEEWERIQEILGRVPTFTELGVFSVMWSEHCSYKNSIAMLKKLPREGKNLLVGAGEENAGLVDIGDGLACAFKIESHNHPSAVEPFQGAATGVGGILRDIFTMGARPIACLNSLRFGPLDVPRNRFLLNNVVKGIAHYGNCMGIPTVGGEIYFDEGYSENPLVNAMAIGIVKHDEVKSATSHGDGNTVMIVGASTGRDGIHGATFASVEISEESESRRSNVQVGDPFTEKLLLEATLELCKKDYVIGIQDMGAAGISCSTSEMSEKGGHGMKIDINKVPMREPEMVPYEVMLSESQERMLVVVRKGFEQEVKDILGKWDLHAEEVGMVTKEPKIEVRMDGKKFASIPAADLCLGGGAPVYIRDSKRPAYLDVLQNEDLTNLPEPKDYNEVLIKLMGSVNIADKGWVYHQYDHSVRTNSMVTPGSSAAVIRLKKAPNKALAASTDGNGRYVYLNPRSGGKIAVAESARNVVCSGAKPLAITNCLNFGNPYDPEVYYQFKEAVLGMGEACQMFDTPVTGGNVSFYNESPTTAIFPTPVIGMLGLVENLKHVTTSEFKDAGDFIVMLGTIKPELGGSEFLKVIHNKVTGNAPAIDLHFEKRIHETTLALIRSGIVKSATDVSDGGLAVSAAESLVRNRNKKLGASIYISRKMRDDELLFSESQSVIIVSISEKHLLDLEKITSEYHVPSVTIGKVTKDGILKINDSVKIDTEKLSEVYFRTLPTIMKDEH